MTAGNSQADKHSLSWLEWSCLATLSPIPSLTDHGTVRPTISVHPDDRVHSSRYRCIHHECHCHLPLCSSQRCRWLFQCPGLCTDCIRIFICVAAHDGRDIGAAFVPPIVQGIKHLFRIRKLLFAVRESASSLKLLFL